MILGDIEHYEKEKNAYPLAIQKGLEHILRGNLAALEPGKYELEGHLMFALVQETVTQPVREQRLESHETYVDIQYLVSGEERIGMVKRSADLLVADEKLDTSDISFYEDVSGDKNVVR